MDIEEILGFQPDLIFVRCFCPWHSSEKIMAAKCYLLSCVRGDACTAACMETKILSRTFVQNIQTANTILKVTPLNAQHPEGWVVHNKKSEPVQGV